MNYFSLELIDGADTSLNFFSEPRFVTLIQSWQNAVGIIQKVQAVGALHMVFSVTHWPLICVLKAIKQQEQRNSNSVLWFLI